MREMLLMERGHCLRDQTLETCGITPGSALNPIQAASIETLRQLVAAGCGCAMFPQMAVGTGMDCGGLVRYLPFGEPGPSRTIGLVFYDRSARAEDAAELAAFLKKLPSSAPEGTSGHGAQAVQR